MTWLEIRWYYTVLYARARANGTTQQAIAERGGIAGQNSVSRLLANDRKGPSVEVFVRAVEGLGMSVSQFFDEFAQAFAAGIEGVEPRQTSSSSLDDGRPYGGRALSGSGLTRQNDSPLTQQQIESLFQAATEGIFARLDQIDARVAALGERDGSVPPPVSPVRTQHFG